MTESPPNYNSPTIPFRDLQKVEAKAAAWKRKAVERREEIEELKMRLSKLEAAFIKKEELVTHLTSENVSLKDEVGSIKRELKVSRQLLGKLNHENQDLKKKAHF